MTVRTGKAFGKMKRSIKNHLSRSLAVIDDNDPASLCIGINLK